MKILIVAPGPLSDLVPALAVASDLARQQGAGAPGVDWVVDAGLAELPRLHASTDRVLAVPVARWRASPWAGRTWSEWSAWRARLRDRRYGLVLVLDRGLAGALLGAQAIGPRVAFEASDEGMLRGFFAGSGGGRRLAVADEGLPVDRMRLLAGRAVGREPVGAPTFGLRVAAGGATDASGPAASAGASSAAAPWDGRPHAALVIAGDGSDGWPDGQWRALLEAFELARRPSLLVVRDARGAARARATGAGLRQVGLVSPPGPVELARTLARAAIVVAAPGGPLQLAAACGTPLVGIYAGSDPERDFPYWLPRAEALGGAGDAPAPDTVRLAVERLGHWR